MWPYLMVLTQHILTIQLDAPSEVYVCIYADLSIVKTESGGRVDLGVVAASLVLRRALRCSRLAGGK